MRQRAARSSIALSHFWNVSDAASSNKDLNSGVDRYRSPARTADASLACMSTHVSFTALGCPRCKADTSWAGHAACSMRTGLNSVRAPPPTTLGLPPQTTHHNRRQSCSVSARTQSTAAWCRLPSAPNVAVTIGGAACVSQLLPKTCSLRRACAGARLHHTTV